MVHSSLVIELLLSDETHEREERRQTIATGRSSKSISSRMNPRV